MQYMSFEFLTRREWHINCVIQILWLEYEFIECETLRWVSQMFCQEVVVSLPGDFVTERLYLKELKYDISLTLCGLSKMGNIINSDEKLIARAIRTSIISNQTEDSTDSYSILAFFLEKKASSTR